MWYNYLNRDQMYLRSYRTHNLWLDIYHKKNRVPKIQTLHVAILRRLAKSNSGVSELYLFLMQHSRYQIETISMRRLCLPIISILIHNLLFYRCV